MTVSDREMSYGTFTTTHRTLGGGTPCLSNIHCGRRVSVVGERPFR